MSAVRWGRWWHRLTVLAAKPECLGKRENNLEGSEESKRTYTCPGPQYGIVRRKHPLLRKRSLLGDRLGSLRTRG